MGAIRLLVLLCVVAAQIGSYKASSSSYDSLIASQCKAKCLSLYPWKQLQPSERRHRSVPIVYLPSKMDEGKNVSSIRKRFTPNGSDSYHHHNGIKWNKVMEMCPKNANCLQCSLPCEIPTNLLPNCRFICKNRHPMCLESCDLLSRLNEQKSGVCPSSSSQSSRPYEYQLISEGEVSNDNCTESTASECESDADCAETLKCCSVEKERRCEGRWLKTSRRECIRAVHSNPLLPSVPFNLTITERKKGKTVILSWDAAYNAQKPTMFVVEGQWSLRARNEEEGESGDEVTKWGYLAQTVNQNWIILRSINRGRWYRFRVAAVSKFGTHGYSAPTNMFMLSAQPKPPAQPENLTVSGEVKSDLVDAHVTWLPSKRSDLPVVYYKLTWQLASDKTAESDTEYDEGEATLSRDSKQNQELIDAQQPNKFTLKGLMRDSVYLIELTAMSRYDGKFLSSTRARTTLDTSLLLADSSSRTYHQDNNSEMDDEENTDEDDDLDVEEPVLPPKSQPLKSETTVASSTSTPMIRNLSVQTAYFQNGLVKAKSSWQIEQQGSGSGSESASLLSKTVRTPLMYTLTWFAIKCGSTVDPKRLPTPITATTINTFFEIYELMHNCDYVLNVRLVVPPPSVQNSASLAQQQPPQVASAQFRVPACERISIIGRIRPVCLNDMSHIQQNDDDSDNKEVERSKPSTTTSTSSPTTTTNPLPKIINIRYKKTESRTLEFYWSLPFSYNRALINGYQISVVPKDIPGVDSSDSLYSRTSSSDGGYFGSVGAIIARDQHSFVVRQLTPRVRYIFQIVAIGLDGQTSGPASSIEFRLNDDQDELDGVSSEARLIDSFRSVPTTNQYYYLNSAATSTTSFVAFFSSVSVLLVAFLFIG